MVLGKTVAILIGNGAEILPLEMGRNPLLETWRYGKVDNLPACTLSIDASKSEPSTDFLVSLAALIAASLHILLISAPKYRIRKINFSRLPSGCQTVWTQIRLDVLSALIWV